MTTSNTSCICSSCGQHVLVQVFNSGGHDCPYRVDPIKGESFADYSARAEAIRTKMRADEEAEKRYQNDMNRS